MTTYLFSTPEKRFGICSDAAGSSLPENIGPWHSHNLKSGYFNSSRIRAFHEVESDEAIIQEMLNSIDNQLFAELVNFLEKEEGFEITKYSDEL